MDPGIITGDLDGMVMNARNTDTDLDLDMGLDRGSLARADGEAG